MLCPCMVAGILETLACPPFRIVDVQELKARPKGSRTDPLDCIAPLVAVIEQLRVVGSAPQHVLEPLSSLDYITLVF